MTDEENFSFAGIPDDESENFYSYPLNGGDDENGIYSIPTSYSVLDFWLFFLILNHFFCYFVYTF